MGRGKGHIDFLLIRFYWSSQHILQFLIFIKESILFVYSFSLGWKQKKTHTKEVIRSRRSKMEIQCNDQQDFYQIWIWVIRRESFKKQELLILSGTWVHSRFIGGVRVAHVFSFLCCIFCFVCFRFVSCVHCRQCRSIVHSW